MHRPHFLLFIAFAILLTGCDTLKKGAQLSFNRFKISSPSMAPNLSVGESYSVISVDSFHVNQYVTFHPLEKLRVDNPDVVYVSRLVGLPGDYLEMRSGRLLLNNSDYPHKINLKHSVEVVASMPLNEKMLEGMEYHKTGYNENQLHYIFNVTPDEIQVLKKNKAVLTTTPLLDKNPINIAPFSVPFNGVSVDTWGPLRVPSKDDSVLVTEENKPGLDILITEHEEGTAPSVGDIYVFQKNYYFVISDNRHNALDSRFLGFIPEDQMVGVMYKDH
ncbi:MAG TPA: S26 family signal peptidase [Ohtaekwangia sp.]